MTLAITPRVLTELCADQVRRVLRRTLEDHGVSERALGAAIGKSPTLIHKWWDLSHAPLYLVAHPRVQTTTAMAIVAAVVGLREDQRGAVPTIETSTAILARFAGEAIALAGGALTDGQVDATERGALRKSISALRDVCDRWLRVHGSPGATSPGGTA